MINFHRILNAVTMLVQVISFSIAVNAQQGSDTIRMIAFFTARNDQAHISFVHEANRWFEDQSETHGFQYDSTNNWNNLNPEFFSRYRIVIFLDTRPESPDQRKTFQNYMEHGGAWLGLHSSLVPFSRSRNLETLLTHCHPHKPCFGIWRVLGKERMNF